jgi:S-adenosylmethionine hydrolase
MRTFEKGPDVKALVGSAGYLEIAYRRGSAAYWLGADIGDAVLVTAGAG